MFNFDVRSPGIYEGYGPAFGSPDYAALRQVSGDSEDLFKAMTTGEGIVSAGDTGTRALRVQFLHGVLERVSFEQDDAALMKVIPKQKVYSNTFEWSTLNQYGGAGDGFVGESGNDSNPYAPFGVSGTDDNFTRQIIQLKYLAAVRNISLPAQLVRNIEDAEQVAERAATLELIGKANLASYFGDSRKTSTNFNGLIRQIMDWVTPGMLASGSPGNPQDQAILYDAGGQPLDKAMLEDIAVQNRMKFGRGDLLIQSVVGYGDTQKLLFPESRFPEGATGSFGNEKRLFRAPYGGIRLLDDPMLRINQPLMVEGPGATGLPRTAATADAGAPAFGSTPFTSITPGSASTGYFWQNGTTNGEKTASTTAPALPTGDGNQANRLGAGVYYYAASAVYQGKESVCWVFGAASVGIIGTPTAVTDTALQVNPVILDVTHITSYSNYALNSLKWRIYRTASLSAAPTSLAQFGFLAEIGTYTDNTAVYVDNGFNIPGTDNAFLVTTQKNGTNGWFMAQLLPLMRRQGLPSYVMGDPLAMLWFATPVLLVPRHHVHVRNVGRA